MVIIVSFIIGLITAIAGSIAGLGGGVILVPVVLFLHEVWDAFAWATPQKVVGISLVVMIFTGLSSMLSYMKSKRIDFKSGSIFIGGSIPGGIFGSYLNQFFSTDHFSLFFGIVMLLVFSVFFIRTKDNRALLKSENGLARTAEIDGKMFHYRISIVTGLLLSFVVGMLSGLFGIGGGSLMVPAMILLFGFPAHIATATSMFMIFFASISSSATHILLGHVDWIYTLAFIPGAYIGGTLGAKINQKLKGNAVEWVLRGLLLLIAIRMIWQGIV
ncbi:sulfite exporter TauE/SafE family protein [Thalassobacillus hwangdonensis]|uniref:Probable membrane transporter protein n=1 Tax=Thalassobacillus hwangdonensis TaxID=546108 RepID=A0ABW3L3V9_9BACI